MDVAVVAEDWLESGSVADIAPLGTGDGIVNMRDFALLAESWMTGAH
jgi:hypothetical protein